MGKRSSSDLSSDLLKRDDLIDNLGALSASKTHHVAGDSTLLDDSFLDRLRNFVNDFIGKCLLNIDESDLEVGCVSIGSQGLSKDRDLILAVDVVFPSLDAKGLRKKSVGVAIEALGLHVGESDGVMEHGLAVVCEVLSCLECVACGQAILADDEQTGSYQLILGRVDR